MLSGRNLNAKKPVKLRGVVTKMEWINPTRLDAYRREGRGPQGDSWTIEAGTPSTLFRRGFTKDSLKILGSVQLVRR
jgi:hypothetical protein